MIRKWLDLAPFDNLLSLPLILFTLFFIGILFWVFRKSAKSKYTEISKLPLEKDEKMLNKEGAKHE